METIRKSKEIDKVFKEGISSRTRTVRIIYLATEKNKQTRLAFIAGKKLGNAPFRSRSKRMLREAIRQIKIPDQGFDIILLATKNTAHAPLKETIHDINNLLDKAGI